MSTFVHVPLDANFYEHYISPHVHHFLRLKLHELRYSADLIKKLNHWKFAEAVDAQFSLEFVGRKYHLSDFTSRDEEVRFDDFSGFCKRASLCIYVDMSVALNRIINDLLQTFTLPPPPKCPTCNSIDHMVCGTNCFISGMNQ